MSLALQENKYIHNTLFVHLQGGSAATIKRYSLSYSDPIRADVCRGICGLENRATTEDEEVVPAV